MAPKQTTRSLPGGLSERSEARREGGVPAGVQLFQEARGLPRVDVLEEVRAADAQQPAFERRPKRSRSGCELGASGIFSGLSPSTMCQGWGRPLAAPTSYFSVFGRVLQGSALSLPRADNTKTSFHTLHMVVKRVCTLLEYA